MALHLIPAGDADAPGLPLLLVHGWCCDTRAMRPVAEAFPERRSLLVDLPGHGASPAMSPLSIPAMARAVLKVAPPRFIAIGHSMGAQVALAMAAGAPGQVAGAVLLDPAHLLAGEKAMAAGEAMRRNLERHHPADVIKAFAARQLARPLKGRAARAFDDLVEAMAGTPAQVAREAWAAVLAWNGAGGAADALARLDVPALVIAIDRPVNRLADLARASQRVMTGQVAGAGHMLQFEAMDQIAPMIRRWIDCEGLEPGAPGG